MKLTPAQRKALEWIRANEPVRWFPCDGEGPSLSFAKKLVKMGLVRETRPAGPIAMMEYSVSDTTRSALGPSPDQKEWVA